MKSFILNHLILASALSIIIFGCNEDSFDSFDPTFTIQKNKIICSNCYDFAKIIVADKDHVLIAGHETIWIVRYDGQNIELIQTIFFNQTETSGIQSMVINNSTLAIGLAEADGIGKVFIYERVADFWELKQEIRIGRNKDNFGSDIDISGDYMVIGASAHWLNSSFAWEEEGRVYIYRKTSLGWIQEHEFFSTQSIPGDLFGASVAIHNGVMLAGSAFLPLHIYKLNGSWGLVRTDTIIAASAISHSGNNFMTTGGSNLLYAFTLESDGGFNNNTMKLDIDIRYISEHAIELKNDLALIAMTDPQQCHLLNYTNNQWINTMVFEPDNGESCAFSGLTITDSHVIVGGRDEFSNDNTGYVYFRNY